MSRSSKRMWTMGPGAVYLLGSLSPADLITHSVTGATYGYSLLWVIVIAYGLNYCIAEATSRYVVATGESIMEGFGRMGRPVVLALAVAIFLRRHVNNLVKVLLMGTAAHLLVPLPSPHSVPIWAAVSFVFAFSLMYRGGYRGVEAVSRYAVVLLVGAFVLVAIIASPSPAAIAGGLLVPSFPDETGLYRYTLLLMAVAGTTVGSLNHLKYPAYVYEKGWRNAGSAAVQRRDLVMSVVSQGLLAVLIQVAAAATLFRHGVEIRTLEDLSRVFSGPLGEAGRLVLGIGIWAAMFMSYIGSNTGYSLLVADAWERFVRRRTVEPSEAQRTLIRGRAYRVVLTFFCVSSLYVLVTTWEPIWLAILSPAFFFVLTPLLLAGLLRMTNDRARMKDRVSGPWSNVSIGLAILLALYLTYRNAIDLLGGG